MLNITRERLIIEGKGCKRLATVDYSYNFLDSLTCVLGMRTLVPPCIVKVPVLCPDAKIATNDYGVSGFIIWIESGAQIHTWPEKEFVSVDLFSCKKFSIEKAIRFFVDWFEPEEYRVCCPATGLT